MPNACRCGDVGPRFFQRDARDGEHLQADQRAGEIEALHDLNEALVLVAEAVRDRNADILEEQRAAADGALAVAVEPVAGDARQIHRDQQRRHAVRAGIDRAGSPEHHGRIGLVGGGDRGLLAVDDIVLAVAFDAQAQIGGVRSAARLGERNGKQGLAGGQAREPRLHDVGTRHDGRGSGRSARRAG